MSDTLSIDDSVDEPTVRGSYSRHSFTDRERILSAADNGDDWIGTARLLKINKKTAYHWIRQNRIQFKKRGGYKTKKLSPEQIQTVISWFEENSQTTLKQAAERIRQAFSTSVSVSTVGNYLDGHIMTLKKIHKEPQSMNSDQNKTKRRECCLQMSEYLRDGRQLIFVDETNFNLFCKRTKGWSRRGDRAKIILPNSKGPNLHLISGMTSTGLTGFTTRRGNFKADDANEWLRSMLRAHSSAGHDLNSVVVISDNAPCHCRFERVFEEPEFNGAELLRLSPYSCMLNPIENIWSKIKNHVKTALGNPPVTAGEIPLGEQRMRRLEDEVNHAVTQVSMQDCLRCFNHSLSFHSRAIDLQDMQVGM